MHGHEPLERRTMNLGTLSSAALTLSGIAAVVAPERVASALDLTVGSTRGRAETRVGLGGTYAALGAAAIAGRDPALQKAVGITWLGAAAVRLAALVLDRPPTDLAYWTYLAAEIACGVGVLVAPTGRRS